MKRLEELDQKGDYGALIAEVRSLISTDVRRLVELPVKRWCARRWRNLFIRHAANDRDALSAASRGPSWRRDPRPARQRIAERFLHQGQDEWSIEMPPADVPSIKRTTLLFCPGLLNGLLPVRAFEEALPAVAERFQMRVLRAKLHPLRGCRANVEDLKRAIDEGLGLTADACPVDPEQAAPVKDLFVVAYSKGTADLLTLLVAHPALKERLRCVFSWCGAVRGSQIADGIHQGLQKYRVEKAEERAQKLLRRLAGRLRLPKRVAESDVVDAVESLTTTERQAFLDKNEDLLNSLEIPFFNVCAATTLREVPWYQARGYVTLRGFDPHNDMQVTARRARVPGPMATDLALIHSHHWDASYPAFPKSLSGVSHNVRHTFPKTAALTAIVELAAELGLIK